MPLKLQKSVRTYIEQPDAPSEAHARKSKAAHTKATQQALLGADLPPSAASTVVTAAMQAKQHARATEIARTAMGLRSIAIAAEALRKIPGGGPAADTLLRSLDAAVNKGGKIKVKGGKLVRAKPTMQPDGEVKVGWFAAVLTVAPYAMKLVGPAIAAAKSGLAKFGPALVSNVSTAASWVAGKVAPLLDKAKSIPGVAAAAAYATKALKVAGAALGIGTAAAALTSSGRAKLREGARRAYAIARTGVSAVKEGATATATEAAAAIPAPSWFETAKSVAPYALGAFLAYKVLM